MHGHLVNLATLLRDVDHWLSGRISALPSVAAGSIFCEEITVYTADET